MDYSYLKDWSLSSVARVPRAYIRQVRWWPRIGDIVPDFVADTTDGPLRFHAWAEGAWVVLFSHPLALTPICTTEVASLACFQPDFDRRGVKLLGISNSSLGDQLCWHKDIERLYGIEVNFPIISDEAATVSDLFGMIHEKQSGHCAIRKTLVVGPDLAIRLIQEYPMRVGRSTEELLRAIDALQRSEARNVGTPADWYPGDDCVLLHHGFGEPRIGTDHPRRRFTHYLTTIADPGALLHNDDT